MYRRPDSVLIISILNICFGGLALLYVLLAMGAMDSLPTWLLVDRGTQVLVLKICGVLDGVTTVVCGFYFLQGANWARWVYTIEAIVSTSAKAVFFYDKLGALVPTIVFLIICIVILFLPESNRYFTGGRRWR